MLLKCVTRMIEALHFISNENDRLKRIDRNHHYKKKNEPTLQQWSMTIIIARRCPALMNFINCLCGRRRGSAARGSMALIYRHINTHQNDSQDDLSIIP